MQLPNFKHGARLSIVTVNDYLIIKMKLQQCLSSIPTSFDMGGMP